MPKHNMTKSDSSRIQSSQAKRGGNMSSGGFASRAQSSGDKWAASQRTKASGFTSRTSNSNRPSTGTGSCIIM
ncbi:hypothetical protein SMACR_12770 [Sordaria macrospora]|uniref:WGS project CABT00000000 data, contig 2.36 n=2 Tax=Sordaria macrospora TaxID=5147 RepID=F7W6U2_SORMK|nr:uncharacterized protein SMAC_12770 [Sordaria macrospora k-hell]KAA8631073.1 hypothetical protein SMACR_12770 [Sordaria macrospora]WPJ63907.1 hypothetical protein SMAC4_12770 [Sordaria macrospora]CCC13232.1 unnamed protein product [Sordaria macrospora k-hell]